MPPPAVTFNKANPSHKNIPSAAIADSPALVLAPVSRDSRQRPPMALANATARFSPDTLRDGRSLALNKALMFPAGFAVVYQGVVTDQHNHPISGALVSLKSPAGTGTVTDALGQFKFRISPVDTTGLLTVSSIGYEQQSLAINSLSSSQAQDNIIRLMPETAKLDEVVVTGFGANRKETRVAAPSGNGEDLDSLWIRAAPVIGRRAYLEYIDDMKNKLGLDAGIHGTETLSFIVNRNGSLTMFKIEQSLSPAHDAGIIRLVTDGPAWRLLTGRPARASVTVNF
ncbi:MAG TPA: carboxypeptidase-like regulatory domain-containing protein [Puia sp.]|nr:carboxypeptidase-like regulatory domain-containing protein [Puia sp.]